MILNCNGPIVLWLLYLLITIGSDVTDVFAITKQAHGKMESVCYKKQLPDTGVYACIVHYKARRTAEPPRGFGGRGC